MSIDTNTLDNAYLLFIRSKEVIQLSSSLNSNMKINLDAKISRSTSSQDIHIQLSSCEIPVSFYNFSSNLNNINLYLDGSPSLILTEQHYDIYDLIDEITNNVSFPYSATFDDKKNKVTLTNTDATQHTINFSQDNSRNLAKALGFNREDLVISSGGTATSNDVINLNTIHSIFVHTNLPVTNVITTTNNNYRNIIQKIPINKPFGEIINYNPYQSSLFSSVINSNEIGSLELSLRDQNDILIDFNDVNYEVSLLFEIHDTNIIPQPITSRRRELETNIPSYTPPTFKPSIPKPIIREIPANQVGGFSQNKPQPLIPIIEETSTNDDAIRDDLQNHQLQDAILNNLVIDDIL
jgi:hypothetical protein